MAFTARLFAPDAESPADPRQGRPLVGGTVRNWRPRVDQLIEKYLRHCRVENVHTPESQKQCDRILGMFGLAYARSYADELVAGDLEEWIEDHPEWKKPNSRRYAAIKVAALYQFGVRRGYVKENPFGVVASKYKPGPPAPELTDDHFERICRRANKPQETIFRFVRLVGCRIHEAVDANWQDLDLDRGVWTVPKHKTVKTTGKPKKKALSAEAVALLRKLKADRPKSKPGDPAFVSTRGQRWERSSPSKALLKIKRALGLDTAATLHGIRHRFTAAALMNGASERQVAEQLGHGDTRMVSKVYADLSENVDFMRGAADAARPKIG
jgi:integrase